MAKSQSKTKKDNNEESGKNKEEPPPNESNEQSKAPSVISTHRSEVPTDVAALTKFLERKEVVFQKKMNDVNEARDRPMKMAHVRILQRWINQTGKYENAVNNLLLEETKNNEEEALLEAWDAFREALDEALILINPYSVKLPKTEEKGYQKRVKDWISRGEDKGRRDSDDAGKGENPSRWNHVSNRQRRRSPSAGSPTCKEVRSLIAKSMADNALKSVPQFSGGDVGYFSAAAASQLLKKTLDGRPKKLVEKMSLQEPDLPEKMMKKLKKEYTDPEQLAVLQKQKIAKHPNVGFGADNLQDFYDLVKQTYSILLKTEHLGDEKEFVSLVLTRLPRVYQNRIDDALDGRSNIKLLLKAMEKLIYREKDVEWRREAPASKSRKRKTKRKETRRK